MAVVHEAVKLQHQTYTTIRSRCIVVGDATAGKTALIKMVTGGGYPQNYVMTTVPEFQSKLVKVPAAQLPSSAPPSQVDLLLLDCPGSSTFNIREAAGQVHWSSAQCIALVFDVGSKESLASLAKWYRRATEARAAADASDKLIGVVIGCKSDFRDPSIDRAEVTRQETEALAESLSFPYFECSSQNNEDVEKPWTYLAARVAKRHLDDAD